MSKRNNNNRGKNRSAQSSNYKKVPDKNKSTEEKEQVGSEPQPESSSEPRNDPSWYARDEFLLRDAASFPFAYGYGMQYSRGTAARNGTITSKPVKTHNVGILALHAKPTLGEVSKSTSPVNVSAASLFAYIRSFNSGRKNYEPVDVFIYFTAIAQLFSFIVWCERLYSFAFTYSQSNRYLGQALLNANHVTNDIMQNPAQFRSWLNGFINRVATFAVPSDITYYNKMVFMYRDVFIEHDVGNIKDQMYMYIPDGFYKFALDNDSVGSLTYIPVMQKHSPMSILGIQNIGEELLEGLWNDEDFALMSGDIFKVYGDNIIRIPSMPEDVPLSLVYDSMVLHQMKNADVVATIRPGKIGFVTTSAASFGNVTDSTYKIPNKPNTICYPGNVYQDAQGNLICFERAIKNTADSSSTTYSCTTQSEIALDYDNIMSQMSPAPTPGDVMESSRMMVTSGDGPDTWLVNPSSSSKATGWVNSGSFIIQSLEYTTSEPGTTQWQEILVRGSIDTRFINAGTTVANYKKIMTHMFQFEYCPMLEIFDVNSNSEVSDLWTCSSFDNYTIISSSELAKLHEVAWLSLFYVPGIGKATR